MERKIPSFMMTHWKEEVLLLVLDFLWRKFVSCGIGLIWG